MSRVYVGGLDERASERDLEDEFSRFGRIAYTWVARKPPGFAFIDFEDPRDAEDAVKRLDGYQGWRVEISKKKFGARAPPGGSRGGQECYNCGQPGHLARDCRRSMRSPPRYSRARSPRRSYSPPRRRRASPTPPRRGRSPVDSCSPPPRRRRSPTPLSRSPRRSVSRSRSP